MANPIFWKGIVVDDNTDITEYQTTIKKILAGEYQAAKLKLKGRYGHSNYAVYGAETDYAGRLLFQEVGPYLVLKAILPTHNYPNPINKNMSDVTVDDIKNELEQANSKLILLESLPQDLNNNNNSKMEEVALSKYYYFNETFITLSNEQNEAMTCQLPLLLEGAPGSGKSSTSFARIEEYYLNNLQSEDKKKALYITKSKHLVESMKRNWLYNNTPCIEVEFLTYEEFQAKCKTTIEKHDFIVVDEAQNNTKDEVELVCNNLIGNDVIFCIGPRQKLNDTKAINNTIKEIFYKRKISVSEISLPTSYRCPANIIPFANALATLIKTAVGDAYKREMAEIKSIQDEPESRGSVSWVADDMLHTLKLHAKTVHFAVIVFSESDREEAIKLYGTALVFTPEEIQGLEYDYILIYNPSRHLSKKTKSELNTYSNLLTNPTPNEKIRKLEEPSTELSTFLTSYFTAATRARKQLWIMDGSNHSNENFISYLNKNIIQPTSSITSTSTPIASTEGEWKHQAEILDQTGNAAIADKIRKQNIKKPKIHVKQKFTLESIGNKYSNHKYKYPTRFATEPHNEQIATNAMIFNLWKKNGDAVKSMLDNKKLANIESDECVADILYHNYYFTTDINLLISVLDHPKISINKNHFTLINEIMTDKSLIFLNIIIKRYKQQDQKFSFELFKNKRNFFHLIECKLNEHFPESQETELNINDKTINTYIQLLILRFLGIIPTKKNTPKLNFIENAELIVAKHWGKNVPQIAPTTESILLLSKTYNKQFTEDKNNTKNKMRPNFLLKLHDTLVSNDISLINNFMTSNIKHMKMEVFPIITNLINENVDILPMQSILVLTEFYLTHGPAISPKNAVNPFFEVVRRSLSSYSFFDEHPDTEKINQSFYRIYEKYVDFKILDINHIPKLSLIKLMLLEMHINNIKYDKKTINEFIISIDKLWVKHKTELRLKLANDTNLGTFHTIQNLDDDSQKFTCLKSLPNLLTINEDEIVLGNQARVNEYMNSLHKHQPDISLRFMSDFKIYSPNPQSISNNNTITITDDFINCIDFIVNAKGIANNKHITALSDFLNKYSSAVNPNNTQIAKVFPKILITEHMKICHAWLAIYIYKASSLNDIGQNMVDNFKKLTDYFPSYLFFSFEIAALFFNHKKFKKLYDYFVDINNADINAKNVYFPGTTTPASGLQLALFARNDYFVKLMIFNNCMKNVDIFANPKDYEFPSTYSPTYESYEILIKHHYNRQLSTDSEYEEMLTLHSKGITFYSSTPLLPKAKVPSNASLKLFDLPDLFSPDFSKLTTKINEIESKANTKKEDTLLEKIKLGIMKDESGFQKHLINIVFNMIKEPDNGELVILLLNCYPRTAVFILMKIASDPNCDNIINNGIIASILGRNVLTPKELTNLTMFAVKINNQYILDKIKQDSNNNNNNNNNHYMSH